MIDQTVVRASSLSTFGDCARRWAANQLWGEITAAGYQLRDDVRSIALVIGTAVHNGAQISLEEKARSGALPAVGVTTDAARDSLVEGIKLGVDYAKDAPNRDAAVFQAVRMAASYHRVIAPTIEPVIVEQRLEGMIPWTRNKITISGQADVVAREPGSVNDLKTGARAGYHAPQIGRYSILARTYNFDITRARIDFVPRVGLTKEQPDPTAQRHSVAHVETIAINVLRHVDVSLSTWREGDPERGLSPGDPAAFMSNPRSQLCNPKYCRAHSCGPRGWCRDYDTAEKDG
jgi:hypothetical protein